jgi:hypothetical protein
MRMGEMMGEVNRIVFLFLIVIAGCVSAQKDSVDTVIYNADNINPVIQSFNQKTGIIKEKNTNFLSFRTYGKYYIDNRESETNITQ